MESADLQTSICFFLPLPSPAMPGSRNGQSPPAGWAGWWWRWKSRPPQSNTTLRPHTIRFRAFVWRIIKAHRSIHLNNYTKTSLKNISSKGINPRAIFQSSNTCIKVSVWNEKSSHNYANQDKELEEPETVKHVQNIVFTLSKYNLRNAVQMFGQQSAAWIHERGSVLYCTNPFWMAARGSLLLRTRIMMMEKRKKKHAMAKHMRYTDL